MLCVFRSLLCTGRGHAQNLFTSRFALFQWILHAQVSGLVLRYRTKSGVSRLISLYKPLLIVFSHIRNRGGDRKFISTMIVMHIELVIKSDTTRAGFIFADLNFPFLSRVQTKIVSVRKILCALTTDESLAKVLVLNSLPNSYWRSKSVRYLNFKKIRHLT